MKKKYLEPEIQIASIILKENIGTDDNDDNETDIGDLEKLTS